MEQKGILHMSTKRKRPQATEKHIWLDCQAPVTLTVFLLALLVFLVSGEGEALFYRDWFSLVKTSFADPAQYVRMFSFVLGSSGFTSFISSWMLFLLVAPRWKNKSVRENLLSFWQPQPVSRGSWAFYRVSQDGWAMDAWC